MRGQSEDAYLHATDTDTQTSARSPLAFLALASFLRQSGIHTVLSRPHFQVENTRVLQPPGKVLH